MIFTSFQRTSYHAIRDYCSNPIYQACDPAASYDKPAGYIAGILRRTFFVVFYHVEIHVLLFYVYV